MLKSIILKATQRTRKEAGEKSETPSEYRQKVIGLVNQLDERQLDKLDKVLELEVALEEDGQEQAQQSNEPINEAPVTMQEKNVSQIEESPYIMQAERVEDVKSAHGSVWSRRLSNGTSAITMLNKLEKQLNDEKNEREKMRKEIEELKQMNQ